MRLWDSLENKGRYATLLGFILGLVAVIVMAYRLIKYQDWHYIPVVIAFGISILLFILPSSFKIKVKDFELEVKD